MDHGAGRVQPQGVGLNGGGVDPGAPDFAFALEDNNAVALPTELAGGGETGGSRADDGDTVGGHRDGWYERGDEAESDG